MIIDKSRFEVSLRNVRRLYRSHTLGELNASSFATKARAELNSLYIQHTEERVEATALQFMDELRSFQTQFGLDLEHHTSLFQVARGYRGIRARVSVRNKVYVYNPGSVEIFIGPFDQWDRVAAHPFGAYEWRPPSFYTKRREKSWKRVEDFDFLSLLQHINEVVNRPRPEVDPDEIPF